ncbi:RES domain protein [Roseovarius sp. THAF27]|uniref:RES domain-containing protein n=1 Tax=Roseovarius sp. THAF27 TaxID=2587850 RepID=UPI001267F3DD|nr:RES domain-containing protein [Roseovarius sp. THAF27]QFT81991.1 RES domain protein [Roseovarius sp. THAF27]
MDHLPRSPGTSSLAAIPPAVHTLLAGSEIVRIWFSGSKYASGFAHFRNFGPTNSQFDHHLPDPSGRPTNGARAILYGIERALDPHAFTSALAEVFQDTRTIDLRAGGPRLTVFQITREISLFDLTGHWTTRVGASASLSSGPRAITKEWSPDFDDAYPNLDGLFYRSAMSGGSSLSLALYERSRSGMPATPVVDTPLSHTVLRSGLIQAASTLGYSIQT